MLDELNETVKAMASPEPTKAKKYVSINIAFTEEQAEQVKADAKAHGLSVTSFMRQLWLCYQKAHEEKNSKNVEKR